MNNVSIMTHLNANTSTPLNFLMIETSFKSAPLKKISSHTNIRISFRILQIVVLR